MIPKYFIRTELIFIEAFDKIIDEYITHSNQEMAENMKEDLMDKMKLIVDRYEEYMKTNDLTKTKK